MIIEINAEWVARCREINRLLAACVVEYEEQTDESLQADSGWPKGIDSPPFRDMWQQFSPAYALNTRQYELVAVAAIRAGHVIDMLENLDPSRISRFEFLCALDEIALHCRKLVESLLLQIGFRKAGNTSEVHEVYSAVCKRDSLNRQQQELASTFGQISAGIANRIADLNLQIDTSAPTLFSSGRLPFLALNRDKKWTVLSTAALFTSLIADATDLEIFALGMSYQGMFGHTSKHVHFSPTRRAFAQVDFPHLAQTLEELLLLMTVNVLRLSSFVFTDSKPSHHAEVHSRFDRFESGRITAVLAGPALVDDIALVRVGDSWRAATVKRVFQKRIDPFRPWEHISYELEVVGDGFVLSAVSSHTHLFIRANQIQAFINEADELGLHSPNVVPTTINESLVRILRQPGSDQLVWRYLQDSNLPASIFAI